MKWWDEDKSMLSLWQNYEHSSATGLLEWLT